VDLRNKAAISVPVGCPRDKTFTHREIISGEYDWILKSNYMAHSKITKPFFNSMRILKKTEIVI